MTAPQPPRAARRALQQRSRPSDEEIARLRAEKEARRAAEGKVAGPAQPPPSKPAAVVPHDPLGANRVKARNAWFTGGQKKQLALILPAAGALTYAANRNTSSQTKVGKRDSRDNRRVAAGAAGGAGLAYATDTVVGAGLKQADRVARDRFKAKRSPEEWAAVNRAQRDHGKAFGLVDDKGKGRMINPATDQEHLTNRSKNTYYRTFPTRTTEEHGIAGLKVPGARAKRINSHRDLKLKSVLAGGALLGGVAASRHREVGKADRHDAQLGYGGAALAAAANYNTPERLVRRGQGRRLSAAEQALEQAKAAPSGPERKAGIKTASGNLQDVRVGIKSQRMPLGQKAKVRIVTGGLLTGVPALYLGGKGKVDKRSSYDRDFAAGTAGAALPIAAAAGTKKLDRKYLKQVEANPEHLKRHNAHRAAHGNPTEFGDSRWNKLYETYPKDLPGGRYRRVAARTLAGKGLPVTMAGMGALAVGTRRAVEKRDATVINGRVKQALKWPLGHKKAIGVPLGIAAAAGVQGHRQGGKHTEGRAKGAAGAAIAGQAAYRGVGYGAKGYIGREDRKAMASGYTRSQAESHKKATRRAAGLSGNPRNLEEQARFARHTVDGVPAAKARRFLGHMGGKQGWAINTAATAGPAMLVLGKKPVEKSDDSPMTRADWRREQERRGRHQRRNDKMQVGLGSLGAIGGAIAARKRPTGERILAVSPGALTALEGAFNLKQNDYVAKGLRRQSVMPVIARVNPNRSLRPIRTGDPLNARRVIGKAYVPKRPPMRLNEVTSGYTKEALINIAHPPKMLREGTKATGPAKRRKEIRLQRHASTDRAVPSQRRYGFPEDLYGETQFGGREFYSKGIRPALTPLGMQSGKSKEEVQRLLAATRERRNAATRWRSPANVTVRPEPRLKGDVGKSREYGYMERKRNWPRTAELGAGLGVGAWGASRLQVGSQVARGVKYAEGKGYGDEARGTVKLVRRGRDKVRHVTGQAETGLRSRIPGFGTALDMIPAKLRPAVATAGGAYLAARAIPTHDERFTRTGSF